MKKITKKHINLIKKGHHSVLMECLEFLLDSYDDDKFNMGYMSAMSDMSVRSYRLAEHIHREFNVGNSTSLEATIDELSQSIEEYFTDALKQ